MTGRNPRTRVSRTSAGLPPPQFGLRSLLWLVTGCAVLFALTQWLSPLVIAALVLLALGVVAHVAGNALGTQLRDLGGRREGGEAGELPRPRTRPQACDYAPPTQLGQRYNLGWPIILATFGGTIAGGFAGGVWTQLTSRGPLDPSALGVGVVAFAALGGMVSFAAVAFFQVGLTALWQAHRGPPRRSDVATAPELASDDLG